MKMSHWMVLASVIGVVSCEESESQCAAACIGSSTLRLYKAEWAEGEHELIVRYPRYDGRHEVRCRFELPKPGSDFRSSCDGDDDDEPRWIGLSVDATVNVHLHNPEDGDVELEMVPPEGEAQLKLVRPAYAYNEICGQVCVAGDEVVELDE